MIMCSAGGTGKTKLLGCIALYYAVPLSYFKGRLECIILSGSEDQAKHLYQYTREAIEDTPIIQELVDGEPLISFTKFKNRTVIRALARSLRKIQGQHGDLVIVDEAPLVGDFMLKDTLRIINDNEYSRIIFSGTPINRSMVKGDYGELFLDIWEDSNKYPEWCRYHWSAMDCPAKRGLVEEAKKLGKEMFDIFWMGKPHPVIDTLVSLEDIKKCSKDVPSYSYSDHGEPPIMGIDWGLIPAPTVVAIVQKVDGIDRLLFIGERKTLDTTSLHQWIKGLFTSYHVGKIYCDSNPKSEVLRLKQTGLPVYPQVFQHVKTELQANLKQKLEAGTVRIPAQYYKLLTQLKRYRWETKENDDYVDAFMLALKEEEHSRTYGVLMKGTRLKRKIKPRLLV